MDDFILEKEIRETLKKKAESVHVDGIARQRIEAKVYARIEEESVMKHKNWKRIAVTAAALCVFGTITATALGKASFMVSHSNRNEAVTSYEEAVKLQSGLDKAVKSVEAFSNGYTFKEALPTYGEAQDEDRNTLGQETTVTYCYEKEGQEEIMYSAGRLQLGDAVAPDATETLEDGTVLSFHMMKNLFLPASEEGAYEITEEQKAMQEAGKLNIAYGTETVEESNSSSVSWTQDGVSYSLFIMDEMSADEMFAMAREIAEK